MWEAEWAAFLLTAGFFYRVEADTLKTEVHSELCEGLFGEPVVARCC